MSTVQLVAQLRKQLQVPLARAKKALEMHQNNYDAALAWLRAQDDSARVQGRATTAGLVAFAVDPEHGAALVELRCETDFVARTDVFAALARDAADSFSRARPQQHVLDSVISRFAKEGNNEETMADAIRSVITQVRENVTCSRLCRLVIEPTISVLNRYSFAGYAHNSPSPSWKSTGTTAAIVALKANADMNPALHSTVNMFNRRLAQHIVGMKPQNMQDLLNQPYLFGQGETVHEALHVIAETPLTIAAWRNYAIGDSVVENDDNETSVCLEEIHV